MCAITSLKPELEETLIQNAEELEPQRTQRSQRKLQALIRVFLGLRKASFGGGWA
jgi:hypothetical protein